MLQDIK